MFIYPVSHSLSVRLPDTNIMIDDVGSQRRTLKELLQERGLNQSSLAKALNIRRQTINVWINEGVIPTQPPSVYLKMCRLLGVTLEELVDILEGSAPFPPPDEDESNHET